MKKKNLTKKDIDKALTGLSHNFEFLFKEIIELKQLFSLYLSMKGETEEFNKFVKVKIEEFEKQQSENKEGT